MPFLKSTKRGWILAVQIQPQSSKIESVGVHGDRLKIKVKAPPVDGAANEELVRFLAKRLGLRQADLEIVGGATSKQKSLALPASLDETAIRAALE